MGRAVVIVAAIAFLGAACSDGQVRRDSTETRPAPDLRLLLLTDLGGTLAPCGCTSRPLGGIDKLGAEVRSLQKGVPTVFMAAGNLAFGLEAHGAGGDPGLPAQDRFRAETAVEVLGRLGLAAAAPGPQDFAHGLSVLGPVMSEAPFPLLAAGYEVAPADENPVRLDLEDGIVIDTGKLKVGILGVALLSPHPGLEATAEPLEAARVTARRLRAEGAQVIVALATGGRAEARRAARALEVDFLLQGGLDEAHPVPPIAAGETLILHAGQQGQGLLAVDVFRRGRARPYRDVGAWARGLTREHLTARIDDLSKRIAAWEKDGEVAKKDLADQRARLAAMKKEAKALEEPLPVPDGQNIVDVRYIELPPEAPKDASITRVLAAFDKKVNVHNEKAFQDHKAPPPAPGQPAYVGSAACQSCHEPAYAWWKDHKHGIAYGTLEERNKEFHLDCVGCHVTGYERPGGSTVTHVTNLTNVGCESCHGPGSQHVEAPEAPGHIARAVPERVCVSCHNPQHSDLFVYDAYRASLLVPGHGKPLPD